MAVPGSWAKLGDEVLERLTAIEVASSGPAAEVKVGDIVLYRRAAGEDHDWLPLVVTNVHDTDTLSGVLYSAFPKEIGIDRHGVWIAQRITRGEEYGNWKPR